jgi:D-3-phosphoglycerate dehydrogenase
MRQEERMMRKRTYVVFPQFGKKSSALGILETICDVTLRHDDSHPSPDELRRLSYEYDGLLVGPREKIDEYSVPRDSRACVVGVLAKAVDNVDASYCAEAGIRLVNAPDTYSRTVAEFVFAQLLHTFKELDRAHQAVVAGEWNWRLSLQSQEVRGKTIGIIGAGGIGSEVARLAAAFEMKILCWTRDATKHRDLDTYGVEFVDLNRLMSESNVIAVALPLTDDTRMLLDERQLGHMKADAFLINVSRGGVVDETALLKLLRASRIRGACLDVFENEPGLREEFKHLSNVKLSPHIAAFTPESWARKEVVVSEGMARAFAAPSQDRTAAE